MTSNYPEISEGSATIRKIRIVRFLLQNKEKMYFIPHMLAYVEFFL